MENLWNGFVNLDPAEFWDLIFWFQLFVEFINQISLLEFVEFKGNDVFVDDFTYNVLYLFVDFV